MNSLIWILAGAMILLSVWLSQTVNQWWLLLGFLVGGYLVVTGFTGRCPVRMLLARWFGEEVSEHDLIDD